MSKFTDLKQHLPVKDEALYEFDGPDVARANRGEEILGLFEDETVPSTEKNIEAVATYLYRYARSEQEDGFGSPYPRPEVCKLALLLASVPQTPQQVFSYLCWIAVCGTEDKAAELPVVELLKLAKTAMSLAPELAWQEVLTRIAANNNWAQARQLAARLNSGTPPNDDEFVPVMSEAVRQGTLKSTDGLAATQRFLAFIQRPAHPWLKYALFSQLSIGHALIALVQEQLDANPKVWQALLEFLCSASATRPTASWLKKLEVHAKNIGEEAFKAVLLQWITAVVEYRVPADRDEDPNLSLEEIESGHWRPDDALSPFLKGVAWSCSRFPEKAVAVALRKLASCMYSKLPNIGPRDAKVANAAMLGLAGMPGMLGLEQIGQLHASVKYHRAWVNIDRYWKEVVAASGETEANLAEMVVGDFGLDETASVSWDLGAWQAQIQPDGHGCFALSWWNPGSQRRVAAVPAEVKSSHAEQAKEIKGELDELKKALTANKMRLEATYLNGQTWSPDRWLASYLGHPLLSYLGKRLIWSFEREGKWISALWLDGQMRSADGLALALDEVSAVRLWHPLHEPRERVLAWQELVVQHRICQPFKQAHREIYVLTDAERGAQKQSLRFAGHYLRQHPLHALASSRGWSSQLRGEWDHGGVHPTISLPHFQIGAGFCIADLDEQSCSNAGIRVYVESRELYFTQNGERMDLSGVPPVAFSEIMRDVDLFISGSIATLDLSPSTDAFDTLLLGRLNADKDRPLSGVAQSRKEILERIIPLLSLKDLCHIEDNYLVVDGKLNSYRIHLGTGNIFMAPDNQYLCIVPKSGQTPLYLPYEGDQIFSLILSKALLLKDDHKIKDPSITSQLKRELR